MRNHLLAGLLMLPILALAAPPDGGPGAGGPAEDPDQRFERMEQRMRVARALGIAEVLELDETQALPVRAILDRFDAQRAPLMRQIHENMRLLRRAASGDAAAQGQVDQATQAVFEARTRIHALDHEMYEALAKGLTPQKRARLAVFLSRFQSRFGMGAGPHGQHGPGGPGGPGMGFGPGQGGPHRGPGMGPGGPRQDCPGCVNE